ncbi:MAG TPA: hypothetical protein VN642_02460 [Dongiaceae bacterium]|nr:hypothetical protein [Dongiaceae bacterium]
MKMDNEGCSCSDKKSGITCRACESGLLLTYWCETCQQPVAEKRCPRCGLKSRKDRRPG